MNNSAVKNELYYNLMDYIDPLDFTCISYVDQIHWSRNTMQALRDTSIIVMDYLYEN